MHNKYLLIWSEAGPVALMAFLLLVGTTILLGWRARRAQDPLIAAVGTASRGRRRPCRAHELRHLRGGTTTGMLWVAAGVALSPVLAVAGAPARTRTGVGGVAGGAAAGGGLGLGCSPRRRPRPVAVSAPSEPRVRVAMLAFDFAGSASRSPTR